MRGLSTEISMWMSLSSWAVTDLKRLSRVAASMARLRIISHKGSMGSMYPMQPLSRPWFFKVTKAAPGSLSLT